MSKRVNVTLDDALYDRFLQVLEEHGQRKGSESAAIARMVAFYCDKDEFYGYVLSRLRNDLEPIFHKMLADEIQGEKLREVVRGVVEDVLQEYVVEDEDKD